MRRFSTPAFFLMLAVVMVFGAPLPVLGQGAQSPEGRTISKKLPSVFSDLIPQGYDLQPLQLVTYGGMGTLEFYAKKDIAGRRDLYYSEYRFDLKIMDKPAQLIKLQSKAYLAQLENDIKAKMNLQESNAATTYDAPKLTRYPWGAGITQRVVHKYMGAGTGPDEIEYLCNYLGVIVGNQSIKKFNLSVTGVDTADEADTWAKKAIEKIMKTGLSNLGD